MQDFILLRPRREPVPLVRTLVVFGLLSSLVASSIVALSSANPRRHEGGEVWVSLSQARR